MRYAAMMVLVALMADAPKIELANASEHVGKEVTVEMVVASSRLLESGKFCFLNSKKSFTDKDNFTIAISADAIQQLATSGVDAPDEHFQGKTIRVRGKVSLHRERVQIVVNDPEQMVIVLKVQ